MEPSVEILSLANLDLLATKANSGRTGLNRKRKKLASPDEQGAPRELL